MAQTMLCLNRMLRSLRSRILSSVCSKCQIRHHRSHFSRCLHPPLAPSISFRQRRSVHQTRLRRIPQPTRAGAPPRTVTGTRTTQFSTPITPRRIPSRHYAPPTKPHRTHPARRNCLNRWRLSPMCGAWRMGCPPSLVAAQIPIWLSQTASDSAGRNAADCALLALDRPPQLRAKRRIQL